jgi:hypothetical protein
MKQIERRLQALEGQLNSNCGKRALKGQWNINCEQLLALVRAGKLSYADLNQLSDEQLWWIIVGECVPMPPDSEEVERILEQALRGATAAI